MYINRSLMMVLALALVVFPAALHWATADSSAWYRPYLLWAVMVLLSYSLHSKRPDNDT